MYKPGVLTDETQLIYPVDYPVDYSDIFLYGGNTHGDAALQVFINKGAKNFVDYTQTTSIQNLGKRVYGGMMLPIDLNNDGFTDIVACYYTNPHHNDDFGYSWGTTFFLNDGTGAFQVVEGTQLLPYFISGSGKKQEIGSFLPTRVSTTRLEGLTFMSLPTSTDQSLNYNARINATSLEVNVRKIVSSSSIGTGPNFANSASLGAPGFNEYYYLRNHPDVAAAVSAGKYPNGLAHYLAEGKAKGYEAFAPNATIVGSDQVDTLTLNGNRSNFVITQISNGYQLTDTVGRYGKLKLQSIERIRFSDVLLNLSAGDVNGDSSVNMTDVILSLQIMAGMSPQGIVPNNTSGADVNGDVKIGIEEAIYILQKSAGVR